MNAITESLLCCPSCKGKMIFHASSPSQGDLSNFACRDCGNVYSFNDGYCDFLNHKDISYRSRWEKNIRSLYAKFYTPLTNIMLLFLGGIKRSREEVLSLLELNDSDIVLETGMGAGDNFPLIKKKGNNIRIFGIDIQKQMMIHCIRNISEWKIEAELFRADAEELPFRDESFDVVFHLGAFNLFSRKKQALDEMIRVAKPGARIVIADESEKGNRIFNLLTGEKDTFSMPSDLIPVNMQKIIIRKIWRGYGYAIAFKKPL